MNWNLARTLRLLSPHLMRSGVGSLTIDWSRLRLYLSSIRVSSTPCSFFKSNAGAWAQLWLREKCTPLVPPSALLQHCKALPALNSSDLSLPQLHLQMNQRGETRLFFYNWAMREHPLLPPCGSLCRSLVGTPKSVLFVELSSPCTQQAGLRRQHSSANRVSQWATAAEPQGSIKHCLYSCKTYTLRPRPCPLRNPVLDLKGALSTHLGPLFCTRRNGLYKSQWKNTLISSLGNLKGFNCRAVNHNAKKHRQIDQIRYETAQTQSSSSQADCRAKIEMNTAHNYSILHFHCTLHPEQSPNARTCACVCIQRGRTLRKFTYLWEKTENCSPVVTACTEPKPSLTQTHTHTSS